MSNLYIYVKTPAIEHVNKIAHIVEHCALNRDNIPIEDFYALCDVEGKCYSGYTSYDIYKNINVEEFIQRICEPLDKRIFKKEMIAFKEETKKENFSDILKKKVEKLFYGKIKELDKKHPSRQKIHDYHRKQYKRSNMVICNSEYKIIENNLKIQRAGKRLLDIKKQSSVSISGEKNKITLLPYTHRKSQTLLYFIGFLYDTYMEYAERHIKGNYHFPTSCMMEMAGYVCIAIPKSIKCDISTKFLDEAKKHFCAVSLNEYARKIEVINLLYIGQLPTDKDIQAFVKDIDIETVKRIIE